MIMGLIRKEFNQVRVSSWFLFPRSLVDASLKMRSGRGLWKKVIYFG